MAENLGWYARLEGGDGVGKTTQISLAKEFAKANGIDAVFIREPGGTEFGEIIREILLTDKRFDLSPRTELSLFTAVRSHLIDTVIQPALNDNRLVIGDRGVESTVCIQSAGVGIRQIDKKIIWDNSRMLLPEWYMQPNGLVVLKLSKEAMRKRLTNRTDKPTDKIEARDPAYTARINDAYEALEDELDYATFVDADRDPEEIFEDSKPILFGPFL